MTTQSVHEFKFFVKMLVYPRAKPRLLNFLPKYLNTLPDKKLGATNSVKHRILLYDNIQASYAPSYRFFYNKNR